MTYSAAFDPFRRGAMHTHGLAGNMPYSAKGTDTVSRRSFLRPTAVQRPGSCFFELSCSRGIGGGPCTSGHHLDLVSRRGSG